MKARFAPSPTGMLHIGGVRTALFAWLAAKHEQGKFVIRIEDTDQARLIEGSEAQIIESLRWLGIESDEPIVRQSERLDLYRNQAQKLIDKGLAYADPYSQAEMEEFRNQAKSQKRPFLFRQHRPENPPKWDGTQPLRFKQPHIKRYEWHDLVRGQLSAGEDALDDIILLKSADDNGNCYPTYNFAHIIDDSDMAITHVLRGEEFIASMANYLALYEALEIDRPIFATMPPILDKEGGKKLSKRDGAKSVLDYRDQGYLPAAVMNFLASLGWNDGTDKEIYTHTELIEAFSLDRIQKSPARFDEQKLNWINWHHVKRLIGDDFDALHKYLTDRGVQNFATLSQKTAQLAASKSRDTNDFIDQLEIFSTRVEVPTNKIDLSNIDPELDVEKATIIIKHAIQKLTDIEFTAQEIESSLRQLIEYLDEQPRVVLMLLRDKITGKRVSPSLFETMEALGKEETLRRLSVD